MHALCTVQHFHNGGGSPGCWALFQNTLNPYYGCASNVRVCSCMHVFVEYIVCACVVRCLPVFPCGSFHVHVCTCMYMYMMKRGFESRPRQLFFFSGKKELSSGVVACICLVSITDYSCTCICTCSSIILCTCMHMCTCSCVHVEYVLSR